MDLNFRITENCTLGMLHKRGWSYVEGGVHIAEAHIWDVHIRLPYSHGNSNEIALIALTPLDFEKLDQWGKKNKAY